MNNCLEKASEYFKPFLLRDIVIKTDKKILRRGVLRIFQLKQYFIRLHLDVDGKQKQYEIPYPFRSDFSNNRLTLNYQLSTVMKDDNVIIQTKLLDTSSKSKIYNNLVYILTSEDNML